MLTSEIILIFISVLFLSIITSATILESDINFNSNVNNNKDDNSNFQLLKINYDDIHNKSSRQNVVDVLKSSLSREGNIDNVTFYYYILID